MLLIINHEILYVASQEPVLLHVRDIDVLAFIWLCRKTSITHGEQMKYKALGKSNMNLFIERQDKV